MNYIWEAVLQVKKNGICDWGLEYQQAEAPSPYMEVSFCDLNTASIEQNIIKDKVIIKSLIGIKGKIKEEEYKNILDKTYYLA